MNIDHSFFRFIFICHCNWMVTRPLLLLVLTCTYFLNICFHSYTPQQGQLVSNRNTTINNTNTSIPITFKGNVPKFGSVPGTKGENYKEKCYNLQENVLKYTVKNYKKVVELAPLIRKLEYVDLSRKEEGPPTGPGNKGASGIAKKKYEIQQKQLGQDK